MWKRNRAPQNVGHMVITTGSGRNCVGVYRVGMTDTPPTIARRWIGDTLRQLRVDAGRSQAEAAARVGKTEETIRRWEVGKNAVAVSYIRDLGSFYDAPAEVMKRLTSLTLTAQTPGLFEGPHVTPDNRVLWENELSAELLQSVELEYIPGLLQTRDYQRAIQLAMLPAARDVQAANRQNRQARQERVLGQANPPRMQFVIGRAAIDYMDAYPEVRADQVARLREVAAMPHVEIRVLHTFHASMLGSFYMITPRPGALGARPFVYLEKAHGGSYEEGEPVVSQYGEMFSAVLKTAIPLEEYLK
jgi:transcriptional regulator with XRE-family HTH domain